MKICSKCRIEQLEYNFYRKKNGKNGFCSQCKRCMIEYSKKYHKVNYEKHLLSRKKWAKNHPELDRARVARRRAKKKSQTPTWADLEKIKQIYLNCPVGMEVDHIIPLKGKIVSGFHVEYNLQYLTKIENVKKGNKL